MKNIRLSVVIPVYNEADKLAKNLAEVFGYLQKQEYPWEVIAVEDDSQDRSLAILHDLARQNDNLRVMHHKPNRGKGYSVKEGVEQAQGQFILFTDADQSTPIGELAKMWPAAEQGYDVIISSRYLSESQIEVKQPWFRRWLGRTANALIQIMVLPGIKDTQNGFKMFARQASRNVFSRQTINRWGFDMELLVIAKQQKLRLKEVPVCWRNNTQSQVHFFRDAGRTLRELIKIRLNAWRGQYR